MASERFAGRVAIATGAGGGTGRATALQCRPLRNRDLHDLVLNCLTCRARTIRCLLIGVGGCLARRT